MTAWGKTGRVTLDGGDVEVDDVWIGYAKPGYAEAYSLSRGKAWTTNAALTLDAAVMWVLQHAVGSDRERTKAIRDVWRAERPVVWRVHDCDLPLQWDRTQLPGAIIPGRGSGECWHVRSPRFGEVANHLPWADAYAQADAYARFDYARQVTP